MGEGLKKVAKMCGGLVIKTKVGVIRYTATGKVKREKKNAKPT